MLAEASVKKPMTVLVCVILVILLGVVAFTRMTPDLLPNIDFPYVIVVTRYIGASPEKIEGEITKPIEQAVATLDNIKTVDSTSNENYSLVILQFTDEANMDAATMNIREKLDQLGASWNDQIGTPFMMKINPNMLPVNVSAVSRAGDSTIELSAFVSDTLLPRLEGIEGVASVNLSGAVSESVSVVLDEEKIAAVNKKIRTAIDGQFEDGEQELADAQQEINDGTEQVASGEKALKSGRSKLNAAAKDAAAQFDAKQAELDAGKATLETAKTQLESRIATAEALEPSLAAMQAAYAALEAKGDTRTEAETAEMNALSGKIALVGALPSLRGNLADTEAALAALPAAQTALDSARAEAEGKIASAKGKLGSGAKKLADAKEELTNAQEQVDDAKEQLSDAKSDAYDAAEAGDIITLENVSAVLGAQDFSMPAGYVRQDGQDCLVFVGDSLKTVEELNGLLLFDLGIDGLEPIYLSDVAEVSVRNNADETYAKINGSNGVLLTFSKQSNYATAVVCGNIEKTFAALEAEYPGLSFDALMDQGDYIHLVIDSVLQNLLLGAVLAVVILYLFLKDLRPTFVIACSIPISVTFAIVLMYFSGVTLNVISMSGLAVGVGMLVDNSIVVIENIYRLRKEGESVFRAAVSGTKQVGGAIISSTLTTVCVFLPIVFVDGITRQLFTDMALTITYSLLASLLVALTLVPAMASGVLVKTREQKPGLFDRLACAYTRALAFALRHKAAFLSAAVALLALSAGLAVSKGFSYMPEMDSPQMSVTITMPDGAMLEESAAVSDEISRRFLELPDVETVGVMQSGGMGSLVGLSSGASANTMSMYVVLRDDKSLSSGALAGRMEALCTDLDCTVAVSGSAMDMSALSGNGIEIDVYGEDLDALRTAAEQIAEKLATVPGVESVSGGLEDTTPELVVSVDKEKAMRKGLTTAQVYMAVAKAVTTEATAATVEESGTDVVVLAGEQDATAEDVKNLVITVTDKAGKKQRVRLDEIAVFSESRTLQSISRSEQRRYLPVTAALQDGYNVTLVTTEAQRTLSGLALPEGVRMEFAGENETIRSAMNDLLLMLLLGVVIVYLIMVAQFQSLLSPFIVLFTIPLAFTGGLFALLIAGFEISIVSMIGFVMLVGIIVNNGIVLIDCMNQLRSGGMERREAVMQACRLRLRPVLMTALTTILGLIPLGLGVGMGASLIQPVAIVAIGGLTYATLMTLFIVPLIYDAWCKRPPRALRLSDLAPAGGAHTPAEVRPGIGGTADASPLDGDAALLGGDAAETPGLPASEPEAAPSEPESPPVGSLSPEN